MEAAGAVCAPRDTLHGMGGGHGDGEQVEVPGDCRGADRSARGWTLSSAVGRHKDMVLQGPRAGLGWRPGCEGLEQTPSDSW